MSAFADQLVEKVALEEALLKVPQGRRVCMALHFVEGFTYKEVGAIVGISEEAVRKRVAEGAGISEMCTASDWEALGNELLQNAGIAFRIRE